MVHKEKKKSIRCCHNPHSLYRTRKNNKFIDLRMKNVAKNVFSFPQPPSSTKQTIIICEIDENFRTGQRNIKFQNNCETKNRTRFSKQDTILCSLPYEFFTGDSRVDKQNSRLKLIFLRKIPQICAGIKGLIKSS